MKPELLQILCCPETHQKLARAEGALVTKLNELVRTETLKNRAGKPVNEPIESGLVREDGKFLYVVRKDIPIMLIDEAISLEASSGS